ncbi:MAG: hypothetical protein QG652_151 [Pseudomonadota bacterium]|nr:hypothetical protein [Pseudomonadota bacterium]
MSNNSDSKSKLWGDRIFINMCVATQRANSPSPFAGEGWGEGGNQ